MRRGLRWFVSAAVAVPIMLVLTLAPTGAPKHRHMTRECLLE